MFASFASAIALYSKLNAKNERERAVVAVEGSDVSLLSDYGDDAKSATVYNAAAPAEDYKEKGFSLFSFSRKTSAPITATSSVAPYSDGDGIPPYHDVNGYNADLSDIANSAPIAGENAQAYNLKAYHDDEGGKQEQCVLSTIPGKQQCPSKLGSIINSCTAANASACAVGLLRKAQGYTDCSPKNNIGMQDVMEVDHYSSPPPTLPHSPSGSMQGVGVDSIMHNSQQAVVSPWN